MSTIADMYMNIAAQNQAERQQMQQQLASIVPSLAGAAQQYQRHQYANQMMNRIDPPRPEAVNPESPEALAAYALGGPKPAHTGGQVEAESLMDALKWERQMEQDELSQMLKEAQIANIHAQATGTGRYAPGARPLTPYEAARIELARKREARLSAGTPKKSLQDLAFYTGKKPADLLRADLAADQTGVKPGNVRIWNPIIDPATGKQVVGGGAGGSYDIFEVPKDAWERRNAAPADSGDSLDDLPVSMGGIDDEVNALFGQDDEPLPAEIAGDPVGEAEGIKEMVRRGAITKEEAVAKLRALGFQ